MKKLKLDAEAVAVESFPTDQAPAEPRGPGRPHRTVAPAEESSRGCSWPDRRCASHEPVMNPAGQIKSDGTPAGGWRKPLQAAVPNRSPDSDDGSLLKQQK